MKKGTQHSEETIQKMKEAKLGKHHSKVTKKKMSEAHIGMKFSEEHNLKIREANLGKHLSEETRKKIGVAHLGTHRSKATKQKISDTLKGRMPANLKAINEKHHGEDHHNWKGNDACHSAIHHHLRNNGMIPTYCALQLTENCKNITGEGVFENININKKHKQTRDPNKYIPACRKCHKLFDGTKMNIEEFLERWER